MGYILEKDEKGNGEPEDLVTIIDKLMADGSGHLNVDLSDLERGIKFTTINTTECGKLGACAQPTEFFEGDDEE